MFGVEILRMLFFAEETDMKSCLKSLSALIAAVVMFSCSQAGKHQALEDIAAESARYIIYGELMPFEKELGDRLLSLIHI